MSQRPTPADRFEDLVTDLYGIHPAIDLIADGLTQLVNAEHTPQTAADAVVTLAGSPDNDVIATIVRAAEALSARTPAPYGAALTRS